MARVYFVLVHIERVAVLLFIFKQIAPDTNSSILQLVFFYFLYYIYIYLLIYVLYLYLLINISN